MLNQAENGRRPQIFTQFGLRRHLFAALEAREPWSG